MLTPEDPRYGVLDKLYELYDDLTDQKDKVEHLQLSMAGLRFQAEDIDDITEAQREHYMNLGSKGAASFALLLTQLEEARENIRKAIEIEIAETGQNPREEPKKSCNEGSELNYVKRA